jgi:hypothetical protein
MHVEAVSWSGMGPHIRGLDAIVAALAAQLAPQIGRGRGRIDWRAHLHPSARPAVSTRASGAAKEPGRETNLTDALIVVSRGGAASRT